MGPDQQGELFNLMLKVKKMTELLFQFVDLVDVCTSAVVSPPYTHSDGTHYVTKVQSPVKLGL